MSEYSELNAFTMEQFGVNLDDFIDFQKSDKFRDKGNLKFKEGKYFAAIAQYNKALVCGRNDKVLSSLCYGNRSAAYLKLEYFKHCLHNIELAEENYPPEKIQKLHERREKCLQMMENSIDKANDAFVHTFKLSYEPSPKLPFFIDSLVLREDTKFGKHLVSTRDLKAGDVIAVMDPSWRKSMNSLADNYVQGCYTCHDTNNGDLIPGDCKALFCSEACKSKHEHEKSHHEEFNEIENVLANGLAMPSIVKFFLQMHDVFGSVDAMEKFVDGHRDMHCTLFDFDWSDPNDPMYNKNMLLVVLNARKSNDDDNALDLLKHAKSFPCLKPDSQFTRILNEDKKNDKFLDQVLHAIKNLEIETLNADDDNDSKCVVANLYHPSSDLLIPSCEQNVIIHTNRKDLIWTVSQPISAGTPIMAHLFFDAKQSWCFHCSSGQEALVSCKKQSLETDSDADEADKLLRSSAHSYLWDFFTDNDPKNLSNWLQYLKSCCDFVNGNFGKFDENPKMKLAIDAKMMNIEIILKIIGNPFQPSTLYLNMDKFFKPHVPHFKLAAWNKHFKSLEIDFETGDFENYNE